jgi:menaquinone-dependent protoporphyrinogen oxidase
MGKSLVVYASKYGSTKEIAEAVAEGLGADVASAGSQPDVTAYDLVVIGSPIYAGDYLRPVVEFVRATRGALSERKVAAFVTAAADWNTTPGLTGDEGATHVTQQDYADGLAELTGGDVIDCRGFGGRMVPDQLDDHDRAMLEWFYRFLMHEELKGFDLLDPEGAKEWGRQLAERLE